MGHVALMGTDHRTFRRRENAPTRLRLVCVISLVIGLLGCATYEVGVVGDARAQDAGSDGRQTSDAGMGISPAVQVSAGYAHSCMRLASGAVACWGFNRFGELGSGVSSNNSCGCVQTPVSVSGLQDSIEIVAGSGHSCARRVSGAVVCWGANFRGQLGDGTQTSRETVTPVSGLLDATAIALGGMFSCARRATGAVVCWGNNKYGQLGDGTTTARLSPVPVSGISNAVDVGAGEDTNAGSNRSCAVRANGAAACWGWNGSGELGDGTTTTRLTPVAVSGLVDAAEVSVGARHACARRTSGGAVCWGQNGRGAFGDGTMNQRLTPVAVSGLTDAVQISVATQGSHTCARRVSGAVVCWGYNDFGQLGDGTTTTRLTPVAVTGLLDAIDISAGASHTCAVRTSGEVVCWGRNSAGQLGDGTMMDRLTPVAVVRPSIARLENDDAHD